MLQQWQLRGHPLAGCSHLDHSCACLQVGAAAKAGVTVPPTTSVLPTATSSSVLLGGHLLQAQEVCAFQQLASTVALTVQGMPANFSQAALQCSYVEDVAAVQQLEAAGSKVSRPLHHNLLCCTVSSAAGRSCVRQVGTPAMSLRHRCFAAAVRCGAQVKWYSALIVAIREGHSVSGA